MAEEGFSFKVEDSKFWILEHRPKEEKEEEKEGEEGEREEEFSADVWIFSREDDAISKLEELLKDENIEVDELEDEDIEELAGRYNLQEVEIAEKKYNMRALSWFKVALRMGLGRK